MSSLPTHPSIASVASVAAARSAHVYPNYPQVEYVLLAEFDIDEGSVLRHEYPAPTGTDQHLLAEHMLPDGAHDRTEDWTVFYLNQIEPLTVDPDLLATTPEGLAAVAARNKRDHSLALDADSTSSTVEGNSGGLLYVLSLVRTKKDATVRRQVPNELARSARTPDS